MPLPDFIHEPVAVTLRFSAAGQPLPAALTWRGRRIALIDIGRAQPEVAGDVMPVGWLARDAGGVTYELRFDPVQWSWTLVRVWGRASAC